MDTNLIDRYGGAVPRYTSYPTAPHFHEGVSEQTYRGWLNALTDAEPISFYFHVPFCAAMCWYCGCHTKVVNRYQPIHDYAMTLGREIELIAEAIPARPKISHVHWGGGTPTMLAAEDFAALMEDLLKRFTVAEDAELAVEIDPRTLTEEMAWTLANAGINRVSLGVQDFNPTVQAAINRVQSYEVTDQAVGWLREAGISAINLDLMYGLPHQGVAEVIGTIDRAMDLSPDRLSLFGYAHVPWMKTHQKMIDENALPDAGERWRHAEAAARRLAEHGFQRIGLDHFARADDGLAVALKNGDVRRNFQGYTTDRASALIGLGASSIGSLPQGYVQNTPSLREYRRAIESGKLAIRKSLELTPDDKLRREIIERLMCDLVVDLAEFTGAPEHRFDEELAALKPMADDGLLAIDGGRIVMSETGRPFVRTACAVFDTYLHTGKARHSQAV